MNDIMEAPTIRGDVRFKIQKDTGKEFAIKTLSGREHVVVPSVILVEGVLHSSNAEHPALALAEEFGIFPGGWDGRPVLFGHPQINGEPVSGNLPDIWNNEVIGHLFGTALKENKKLATFLWLDQQKTPKEVFDRLNNNEAIEVSTGLWALEEQTKGTFGGRKYEVVWRNITPDHLAVLPAGTKGACSVEDGCGMPRTNQMRTVYMDTNKEAQPSQPAANACGCDAPKASGFFGNFLKALGIGIKDNELSDMDRRTALEMALGTKLPNDISYVMAVYDNSFVYATMNTQDFTWRTYSRSYTVSEGGAVSIGDDATEVRPETSYVPFIVNSPQQSNSTGKETEMDDPNKGTVASGQAPNQQAAPTATSAPAQNAETKKATTMEELLANADASIVAGVKEAMAYTNSRKEALVKMLSEKAEMTAEELNGMSISILEKMAKAVDKQPAAPAQPQHQEGQPRPAQPTEGTDFSGAAGGARQPQASEKYTPSLKVFEGKPQGLRQKEHKVA